MTTRPLPQKTIGVLGGCSNVATGFCYEFLNEAVNKQLGGWDIAETLIAGMNFGNVEAFIRNDQWAELEAYMAGKIDGLIAGGADVIICASNTLHKPLETIMENHSVPFIHIVDPTAEAIKQQGLQKIALFGTKPVMEMAYLRERFEQKFDLTILVPTEKEQIEIDAIIFNELVKGKILPKSKTRYLEIADRLMVESGAEGLILGCTEIFLLIEQADRPSLPMFNTTKLHCDAAIAFALS